MEDSWVSDAPYLHMFVGLEHMMSIGKKLVQIDFGR
jgi:hypothetical protein